MINLWDDPGFENADAPDDVGTPTTSEQSVEQAHTGSNSWKVVTDAADEGISRLITTTSGKYYLVSCWIYGGDAGQIYLYGVKNDGSTGVIGTTAASGAWVKLKFVMRATAAAITVRVRKSAAGTFYVDDVSVVELSDVSLTCTPAIEANSLEGTGIRVDGYDTFTVPVTKLKANKGRIKFYWTPRHNAADFVKYGIGTPRIFYIYGDASNYLTLTCQVANTIRLGLNANGVSTGANWDCTGLVEAGTKYLLDITYSATKCVVKIDGVVVITATQAINFVTLPGTFQLGDGTNTRNCDSVFSPP